MMRPWMQHHWWCGPECNIVDMRWLNRQTDNTDIVIGSPGPNQILLWFKLGDMKETKKLQFNKVHSKTLSNCYLQCHLKALKTTVAVHSCTVLSQLSNVSSSKNKKRKEKKTESSWRRLKKLHSVQIKTLNLAKCISHDNKRTWLTSRAIDGSQTFKKKKKRAETPRLLTWGHQPAAANNNTPS